MTYEHFYHQFFRKPGNRQEHFFLYLSQKTVKNNGIVLDCLSIRQTDSSIAPSVSLTPFYEEANAVYLLKPSPENSGACIPAERVPVWAGFLDLRFFTGQNAYRLPAYLCKKNEHFCHLVPHTGFLNLALIFM